MKAKILFLLFEPAKKYENYSFKTEFVLHNSTVINDEPEYVYTIKNTKPGTYDISMSASCKNNDAITATGHFNLVVKE